MNSKVKKAFADDLAKLFNRLDSLEEREETEANRKARDLLLARVDTYKRSLNLIGYTYELYYKSGFEVVEIIKL